jgi:hypothetical protein
LRSLCLRFTPGPSDDQPLYSGQRLGAIFHHELWRYYRPLNGDQYSRYHPGGKFRPAIATNGVVLLLSGVLMVLIAWWIKIKAPVSAWRSIINRLVSIAVSAC